MLRPSLDECFLSGAVRKGPEKSASLRIVQLHDEGPIGRDRLVGSVQTAQFGERVPRDADPPKLPLELV
jgi:hypothetical protein